MFICLSRVYLAPQAHALANRPAGDEGELARERTSFKKQATDDGVELMTKRNSWRETRHNRSSCTACRAPLASTIQARRACPVSGGNSSRQRGCLGSTCLQHTVPAKRDPRGTTSTVSDPSSPYRPRPIRERYDTDTTRSTTISPVDNTNRGTLSTQTNRERHFHPWRCKKQQLPIPTMGPDLMATEKKTSCDTICCLLYA